MRPEPGSGELDRNVTAMVTNRARILMGSVGGAKGDPRPFGPIVGLFGHLPMTAELQVRRV